MDTEKVIRMVTLPVMTIEREEYIQISDLAEASEYSIGEYCKSVIVAHLEMINIETSEPEEITPEDVQPEVEPEEDTEDAD